MTPRRLISFGLLGLLIFGIGNFTISSVRTRASLGLVAQGGSSGQEGVKQLMDRNVLFDSLQGGAPPKTRLNAIAALTTMAKGGKEPAAFQQLLQMLKDPDTESLQDKTHPVRDAAKDAVASVGQGYPDLLLDAAKDPDGNIHDQARAALKQIGAPLAEKMASRLGDSALRAPLGDILSGIGPQTVPLIAPYLSPAELDKFKDKPDDLATAKLELIEIMGKFKTAEAAKPILPFEDDPNPNVRRDVLTSLANIADPIGEKALIAALSNTETDATARAASAGALGAFGTTEANAAMVQALSDYDLSVADAAAAGLARAATTNEATATVAIAQALGSSEIGVRARAAAATSGMRSPALAIRALKDTEPTVRTAAIVSLGDVLTRKGNEAAIPVALPSLLAALHDSDGQVVAATTQALARIGTPAIPSLVALLSDPQETVAYDAAHTLAGIGKPAFDEIAPAAQLNKPGARWAAVALGEIGDVRAEPILEALTKSSDPDTAFAAETALARVRQG